MRALMLASVFVVAGASGAQAICWDAWNSQGHNKGGCWPTYERCMTVASWVVKCTKR